MTNEQAQKNLITAGAVFATREDRHGTTLSGWWMDGVYLGSTARLAWEALAG